MTIGIQNFNHHSEHGCEYAILSKFRIFDLDYRWTLGDPGYYTIHPHSSVFASRECAGKATAIPCICCIVFIISITQHSAFENLQNVIGGDVLMLNDTSKVMLYYAGKSVSYSESYAER